MDITVPYTVGLFKDNIEQMIKEAQSRGIEVKNLDDYVDLCFAIVGERNDKKIKRCFKNELVKMASQSLTAQLIAQKDLIHFYDSTKQYGELSNFYKLKKPITHKGKTYPTSEHLYQAAKFMFPGASAANLAYADVIRRASTPNIAKILAGQKTGGGYAWRTALNPVIAKSKEDGVTLHKAWEENKVDVMLWILRLKFTTDAHCRQVLKSTGSAVLAEHTERDMFWGDGGKKGGGKSMLGELLADVRSGL